MRALIRLLFNYAIVTPTLAIFVSLIAGLSTTAALALLTQALYGRHDLRLLMILWLLIAVGVGGRAASRLLIAIVTRTTVTALRRQLATSAIGVSLKDLEQVGPARITNAITSQAARLGMNLPTVVSVLSNIAFAFGCLGYLFYLSPRCFLFVIATLFVTIAIMRVLNQRVARLVREANAIWENIVVACSSIAEGSKQLKLSSARRELVLARLDGHARRSNATWAAHSIYANALLVVNELAFFGIVTLVVFEPAILNISGEALVSCGMTILYLLGPLREIAAMMPVVTDAESAHRQIGLIGLSLRKPESLAPSEPATPLLAPKAKDWRCLRLSNVGYDHQSATGELGFRLESLSATLERGSIVFVVGGNGSGKTTLAKVICGLYPPSGGAIHVDQVDLDGGYPAWSREQVGAIFNDFVVFDELTEKPDEATERRARELLSEFGLEDRIGLAESRLSRTKGLSTGERKRLALISTLIEDRNIMVFDEWAADQDPQFRDRFYRKILPRLRESGKLVFVISHDDRYFDLADTIIALERGERPQVRHPRRATFEEEPALLGAAE
jgi:putative ATP-binding cassette transporter